MNENDESMTNGVAGFLQCLGLEDYLTSFLAQGYDREVDMHHLTSDDLDCLLISDASHRNAILSSARKHKSSEEGLLLEWLRDHHLEHYFVGFIRSDLITLEDVGRLNLPDDNLYDELEITMPGHRRRLDRAVHQLQKRRRHASDAEVPVAEGFWGKPTNLEDAKYDFLCVEATISSTKDSSRKHTVDFMVDSGSDVTTLQEDLLYTLNPVLLGPINSKGVHSSKRKNLYKALLTVGTQRLEIEVMGETYNSLGNRVLRHFRHYITGSKHIWLSGDYFDPVMSMTETVSKSEASTSSDSNTLQPSKCASSEASSAMPGGTGDKDESVTHVTQSDDSDSDLQDEVADGEGDCIDAVNSKDVVNVNRTDKTLFRKSQEAAVNHKTLVLNTLNCNNENGAEDSVECITDSRQSCELDCVDNVINGNS